MDLAVAVAVRRGAARSGGGFRGFMDAGKVSL